MKAVLDTNVLISAIFWEGPPNRILRCAEAGLFTIVSSREILREFFGVIARPKFALYLRQTGHTPDTLVQQMASLVDIVEPYELISAVAADPSDNKFLSCAVSCNASFLVSGDSHLLDIKQFRNVAIVTPAQFLQNFQST